MHSPADSTVQDPDRGARRIALLYVAAGVIWIAASDRLLALLVSSAPLSQSAALFKGCAYVLVTGYLLYAAISRLQRQTRAAQASQVESERAYRAMFDNNPNPMWVCGADSLQLLAVNAAALQQYGFSRAELLRMTLYDLHWPAARAELARALQAEAHVGDVALTGTHRHSDKAGALLYVDISSHRITFQGEPARLMLAQNVSARVRAERELHESRRQLEAAQRIGGLGAWFYDLAADSVTCSDTACQILGLDPRRDRISPERIFGIVHPQDQAVLQNAYEAALQGRPLEIEVRLLRGHGDLRYVHLRGELVEPDGSQMMGMALDITERKLAEIRLFESERQHRQLIDLMPEGIVLIDSAGAIAFANPAAAHLFGADRAADLYGVDPQQLVGARGSGESAGDGLALPHGDIQPSSRFIPRQLKKIGGEVFEAEVAAQLFLREGERCIQVVVRDVGAQKKMQEALRAANARLLRLSRQAIELAEQERRQLARELHDDVGQLLTYIKMSAAWVQKRVADAACVQRVEAIHASAGEALQKVRNLSLLLRPAQLDTQGLSAAIEWQLQHYLKDSGIDYTLSCTALEPRPDPNLEIALFRIFQEGLTNIIRHSGAGHVEIGLERSGGQLRLRIVDDGSGFERAAVAATSLGLTTMAERAQQAGGLLQVSSVLGAGTELIAILPETGYGE